MKLVSRKGSWGALWTPHGSSLAPAGSALGSWARFRQYHQLLWKCVFQLLGKFGSGNKNHVFNVCLKHAIHLSGKSGPENQTSVKFGRHFLANKCWNQCFCAFKWASRNSPGYFHYLLQSSGSGGRSAFRNQLSSRAGVQDYGSFKQTPSNDYISICRYLYISIYIHVWLISL